MSLLLSALAVIAWAVAIALVLGLLFAVVVLFVAAVTIARDERQRAARRNPNTRGRRP